jgi:hypothetical protein
MSVPREAVASDELLTLACCNNKRCPNAGAGQRLFTQRYYKHLTATFLPSDLERAQARRARHLELEQLRARKLVSWSPELRPCRRSFH